VRPRRNKRAARALPEPRAGCQPPPRPEGRTLDGCKRSSARLLDRQQSIAALEPISTIVHVVAGREHNGLDQSGANQVAGAPGRKVVGVARNPEGHGSVPPCEWSDESHGSSSVTVSAMWLGNRVAYVTCIAFEPLRSPNSEAQQADGLPGRDEHDGEVVCRYPPARRICWSRLPVDQGHSAVAEVTGVRKYGSHLHRRSTKRARGSRREPMMPRRRPAA